MTKLVDIEGIGETYAEKLEAIGISTIEQLLEKGAQPSGRKSIAEDSGISSKLVLKWLNRADLARVKGISTQYADLLEFAGVDTVPELAQRNAANLTAKMAEVNEEKNLVRQLPGESKVEDWIAQAKDLPRAIHY
ncbi:ferredoxin [Grimontia sp. AD028]|uniref:DUF4332 domain-containing protein n=2 Tax=Grimontia TaxID=246861 RepID=R1GTJ6_9GAMM|nr:MULTISPECIES: DUF4332 domain-containing protein [Grimontia]EOD79508.1 hypothetical protein D515_01302 [Grimontia indica]KKD61867.1 ferredoxin [Grimontia sp. AD028]NGN96199.1 DUF4332 domain-containing protein [Grimontia sedimenti]